MAMNHTDLQLRKITEKRQDIDLHEDDISWKYVHRSNKVQTDMDLDGNYIKYLWQHPYPFWQGDGSHGYTTEKDINSNHCDGNGL